QVVGWVCRKRPPRGQSAADGARVACDMIEESESLAETNTVASSAEVRRDSLPPPVQIELPAGDAAPPPASASGPSGPLGPPASQAPPVPIPDAPAAPPASGPVGPAAAQPMPVDLDRALAADPDAVPL